MMNIATNAYQVNDSLLAGKGVSLIYSLNNAVALNYGITGSQSAKIYANQSGEYFSGQSAKHFANQSILTTVGGWDNSDNLKRGEFTPFAKGDFSHLCKVGKSRYLNSFISKNGKIEFYESIKGKIIEFFESIKKGSQSATLGNVDIEYRASENYQHSDHFAVSTDKSECLVKNFDDNHFTFLLTFGYSKNALAKSSARIGVLNIQTATHDAPSVFFCVHAYAHLQFAVLYRSESMVAAAEQPQGWLVSVCASNANSTVVTTPEIGVSSGDSELIQTEIIVMMATPTQTQFKFLFLAVKRTDKTDTPHRIEATAPSEHDARLMLVRDYILSFAGRLPVKEVAA